jgi:hypothetical protein
MNGYFDDNGNEINPSLYPKPQLCLSCKKDEMKSEEILCNLNRIDHIICGTEFKCYAYERK